MLRIAPKFAFTTYREIAHIHTLNQSAGALEATLALLKPDILANPAFVDSIINDIQNSGMKIALRKQVFWTQGQAEQFYAEHRRRFFFDRLVKYMTSGPVEAIALSGPNVISWWRQKMGATRPAQMRMTNPTCLRARYGLTDTRNSFHGSDSVESAKRELVFVFGQPAYKQIIL